MAYIICRECKIAVKVSPENVELAKSAHTGAHINGEMGRAKLRIFETLDDVPKNYRGKAKQATQWNPFT